ncbi:hypothetical protein CK203_037555 [Vitis vinifera]|uniref:Uncharacterized protein n=1 Tax=Vitis vinifera TaxID=29760 RepID=A0A438HMC8_VITVI|nr:hypothetical protein CK203_037555 [Vitis vinifera]
MALVKDKRRKSQPHGISTNGVVGNLFETRRFGFTVCARRSIVQVLPSSKTPQPPPSVIRLWRPAAQRNLRNQWSKLASYRQQWTSTASKGRYMPAMELGVLSDMPNIRKKACMKLLKQQEICISINAFQFKGDEISSELLTLLLWFTAWLNDFLFCLFNEK